MIELKYLKWVSLRNIRMGLVTRLLIGALFIAGCSENPGQSSLLPESTGEPGELVVVMDTSSWNSVLGDSVMSCFSSIYPGLPEPEPLFDVLKIQPRAFTHIFKATGNILVIEIDKSAKLGYVKKENVWASHQMFVKIVAPSVEEGAKMIGENKEGLISLFYESGMEKLIWKTQRMEDPKQSKIGKEKLGVDLVIPKGYKVAKTEKGAVYWRRDRKIGEHSVIQGLLAYKTPYRTDADLGILEILDQRDSITKQLVLGSKPKYYMEVYRVYEPDQVEFEWNGNYIKQSSGLWRMNGEMMGGPFTNLSIVKQGSDSILVIDGYVYSPRFNKRRYIKELEAIARLSKP